MRRLSLAAASRCSSSYGVPVSHCGGFSCGRARAPGHLGFSSCDTKAE